MRIPVTAPLLLPAAVKPWVTGAVVYNSSSSQASQTYYAEKRGEGVFIKVGPTDLLEREWAMDRFLAAYGLGPDVLDFGHEDGSFLVTRPLGGEDGISGGHLDQPGRLAQALGSALRVLHSLPTEHCPFPHRSAEMRALAAENIQQASYDSGLIPERFDAAVDRFRRTTWPSDDLVVLHGDFCLPNVLFQDFRLTGFVDLGNGGVGERHYDLYWGLWTLGYNTKSDRYNDTFLAAYGRDLVVPELLEFHRLLSGFMN
jgi:kanamycin kinase